MVEGPGYVSNPEMWDAIVPQMRSGVIWRPILAVDFDGTCAITHVTKDIADLDARPVYAVAESLRGYCVYFDVFVVSARASCRAGADAILRALMEFGLREEELAKICVTNCKPPAHVSIDDRCWCFRGKWPQVEKLLAFAPWHGRGIVE